MKRELKKNFFKIMIFIIVVLFFLLTTSYALLSQKVKIIGKSTASALETNKDVITSVDTSYRDGLYYHHVFVTVFNHQKFDMYGWNVSMTVPEDTTIIEQNKITPRLTATTLVLISTSENHILPRKANTSFSFVFSSNQSKYQPTNIKFNGIDANTKAPVPSPQKIAADNLNIQTNLINKWNESDFYFYEYEIILSNIGSISIHSWNISALFSHMGTIKQIWNASFQKEENLFTFSNSSFNGVIQPKEEISFGFIFQCKQDNSTLSINKIILQ